MPDQPTYRPVHKALHRPLTICDVDRRLFFLALLMGAATFNLFYSFWASVLVFAGLYGFALWATHRDPNMGSNRLCVIAHPQTVRPREARALRSGGRDVVRLSRTRGRPRVLALILSVRAFWFAYVQLRRAMLLGE